MNYVTSVDVDYGGHVGTPASISKTVSLAAVCGIGIGFWWMGLGLFSYALGLSSLGLCRWPSLS